MSSHPNVVLVASVKVPEDQINSFLGDDYNGVVTLGDTTYNVEKNIDNDSGIPVEEGCVGLYSYVCYGWGDSRTLEDLNERISCFKEGLESLHDKGYPYTIHLGTNWF